MLKTEVVLFGYYDHRVDETTPFGFVMLTGEKVEIHYRKDIEEHELPEMFEFSALHLPAIIEQKWAKYAPNPSKNPLYDFLMETCFNTVGNFRCWDPMTDCIVATELVDYVFAIRGMVDERMAAYRAKLEVYVGSCTPVWLRTPTPAKHPKMPSLAGSFN